MATDADLDDIDNCNPLADAIHAVANDYMEKFFTSQPCRVEAYDPVRQTVDLQPYIHMPYRREDGETDHRRLPMTLDVPVLFPGSGKNRITWPIEKGDTVIAIYPSHDLVNWLVQGREVDTGKSFARHHLSFALALPTGHSLAGPCRAQTTAPTDAIVVHAATGKVVKLVSVDAAEIVAINSELAALTAKYNDLVAKFNGHVHLAPSGGGETGGPATALTLSPRAGSAAANPVGSPRIRVP